MSYLQIFSPILFQISTLFSVHILAENGPAFQMQTRLLLSITDHFLRFQIFPHISLHLHLIECFSTRKMPHIPDSTSQPKLPERYR